MVFTRYMHENEAYESTTVPTTPYRAFSPEIDARCTYQTMYLINNHSLPHHGQGSQSFPLDFDQFLLCFPLPLLRLLTRAVYALLLRALFLCSFRGLALLPLLLLAPRLRRVLFGFLLGGFLLLLILSEEKELIDYSPDK